MFSCQSTVSCDHPQPLLRLTCSKTGKEAFAAAKARVLLIMGIAELLLLAIGLSMDAFAVSVCKGLAMKKISLKEILVVGLWFGGFQMLMPIAGYYLGSTFASYIDQYDHWIAFVLLVLIGVNMIRESLSKEEEEVKADLSVKTMFLMAVATSIDALAVGITFAFLNVNVFSSGAIIGLTTFAISAVGVKIGNVFGTKYKSKAELAGGAVLILLGLKILLEGLQIISF